MTSHDTKKKKAADFYFQKGKVDSTKNATSKKTNDFMSAKNGSPSSRQNNKRSLERKSIASKKDGSTGGVSKERPSKSPVSKGPENTYSAGFSANAQPISPTLTKNDVPRVSVNNRR